MVADRTLVNGSGFHPIAPEEYLKNIVAIKTLLNEKKELQDKLLETVDPASVRTATFFSVLTNLVAMVLIGVGTNLITGDHPPPYSYVIFCSGLALALIATVVPAYVAFHPEMFKNRKGK